jgi:hypothetical protein
VPVREGAEPEPPSGRWREVVRGRVWERA